MNRNSTSITSDTSWSVGSAHLWQRHAAGTRPAYYHYECWCSAIMLGPSRFRMDLNRVHVMMSRGKITRFVVLQTLLCCRENDRTTSYPLSILQHQFHWVKPIAWGYFYYSCHQCAVPFPIHNIYQTNASSSKIYLPMSDKTSTTSSPTNSLRPSDAYVRQ